MIKIIDCLIHEEKLLITKLNEVRELLKEHRMRDCFEQHGVKVGSIIKICSISGTGAGIIYKVTGVSPSPSGGRPFLEGRKQKNDGGFGKQIRGIYGAQIEVLEA